MSMNRSNKRSRFWLKVVATFILIDLILLVPYGMRALAGGSEDVFLASQFGLAFLFLIVGGKIRGWSETGTRSEEPSALGRVIGMGIIIVGLIFMCRGIFRLLHLG